MGEGGGGLGKSLFHGRGMDIVWNYRFKFSNDIPDLFIWDCPHWAMRMADFNSPCQVDWVVAPLWEG